VSRHTGHQSSHAAADHRVRAGAVEKRVEHVSRRRSIRSLLDRDRDGTDHDEHEKRADAEINRLP
jgi:hypothetical protein